MGNLMAHFKHCCCIDKPGLTYGKHENIPIFYSWEARLASSFGTFSIHIVKANADSIKFDKHMVSMKIILHPFFIRLQF